MDFLKRNLIDALVMLSNLRKQQEYYDNVSIADVPSELISAWFDDGFYLNDEEFKKQFSEKEWEALCEFNNFFEERLERLPERFEELMKCKMWFEIVNEAKLTLKIIEDNCSRLNST
ncbi:MAG: hypothetical protein P8104_03895 [Gammaproteobacteria bacterium]